MHTAVGVGVERIDCPVGAVLTPQPGDPPFLRLDLRPPSPIYGHTTLETPVPV